MRRRAALLAAALMLAGCTTADTEPPPAAVVDASAPPQGTAAAPSASSPAQVSATSQAAETPKISRGSVDCSPYVRAVTEAELSRCLAALVADANRVWANKLRDDATPWLPVRAHVVPPGETLESGCAATAGNPDREPEAIPAFYCPADNGAYLDTSWLYKEMWTIHLDAAGDLRPGGDLAVAYVVAHEVGHAVQFQQHRPSAEATTVRPKELQADCYAGIWADEKYLSGQLDTAKIGAAMDATREVGDYEYDHPQHHGTPAERTNAFRTGYRSGEMTSCPLDVGAMQPTEEATP